MRVDHILSNSDFLCLHQKIKKKEEEKTRRRRRRGRKGKKGRKKEKEKFKVILFIYYSTNIY